MLEVPVSDAEVSARSMVAVAEIIVVVPLPVPEAFPAASVIYAVVGYAATLSAFPFGIVSDHVPAPAL